LMPFWVSLSLAAATRISFQCKRQHTWKCCKGTDVTPSGISFPGPSCIATEMVWHYLTGFLDLMKNFLPNADSAHWFSISLLIAMPCESCVIKIWQRMPPLCCFPPISDPFLLSSGLVKSQSTHFPCYPFWADHCHLKGWTTAF
jgi:hypothetical protein